MIKIINLLKNFNELVMFKHSIFSLPFIFIAMIVAAEGWFGWQLFFLCIFSTLSARNFAMGFNRYLDKDIDALNPRTQNRPNVDGRISSRSMLLFIFVNAVSFIVIAWLINYITLYLSVPILFIIASYSYFKRFSYFAHLILGISLAIAPIAGVLAVSETVYLWTLFLSLGVIFWVAGFDLLYSLQDIQIDKKLGLHSVPSKFGVKTTVYISKICHILTVFFWGLFVIASQGGIFAYIAIFATILMLLYEHYLLHKDFQNIDKAFFIVNGYIGIVFVLFIVLDNLQ